MQINRSVCCVSATIDVQALRRIYQSAVPPIVFRNIASSLQKLNEVSVEEGRTPSPLLYGKHHQQCQSQVPLT